MNRFFCRFMEIDGHAREHLWTILLQTMLARSRDVFAGIECCPKEKVSRKQKSF